MKKKLIASFVICFLTITFCLLSGCTSTEGTEQTRLNQSSGNKVIPTEEPTPTVVPTEEYVVQPVYTEEETLVGIIAEYYQCSRYADRATFCLVFEDGRQMKIHNMREYEKGGYPAYESTKTTIYIMEKNLCPGCEVPGGPYKIHITKISNGFWLIDEFKNA